MEIEGRTVLILGGSGLVGTAVARRLLRYRPEAVVISALRRDEAEAAAGEVRADAARSGDTEILPEWGDIFVPDAHKTRPRSEMMADPDARRLLLDDLYGELTSDVVERSTLGAMLLRRRPAYIIDCVNTATAFAYRSVYESAAGLRSQANGDGVDAEAVERHLSTLYLPQLIRHVQIALEGMRRVDTQMYLKVGTSGTGGMGLNIPFTHSEERPSRVLLSKAGLAGAQTLLLYLMARTPGAPAVKEIKPTAAISWKRVDYGEIRRGGRPIERYDATRPVALDDALGEAAAGSYTAVGDTLEGVYLDSGENGLFSLPEFETLTALGLMEFITPEEIADNVIREIRGHPTGRDVVAALDGATSGPTYRAGVLRQRAIDYMGSLEQERGVEAVAYEMLGPPRLTKLLFEGAILARLFDDVPAAARLEPEGTAERARALIDEHADLRIRILSVGLPILLPGGRELLRGPEIKVAPTPGQAVDDPRVVDNGWIDLRPANWRRWRDRLARMDDELRASPGVAEGSRADVDTGNARALLRPGRLAAWVFRHEDEGERMKR